MLDAIRPDGVVPLVPLEPTVLHNIGATTTITLERLEHGDIVCVAHTDLTDDARNLQGDQSAPGDERLRERAEGRVQHEGVEVRCAEIPEGCLDGGLDLGGNVGLGIVGEGLG